MGEDVREVTRAAPSSSAGERVGLRVLGLVPGRHTDVRATAPTLAITIESSVAQAESRGARFAIDRSSCLLVPRGGYVTLHATGAARVALLELREPLVAAVAAHYAALGLKRARLERWLERLEQLPRTVWVHEIIHRYVFERYALNEHDNFNTRFLEVEILKEIYFLFRDREAGGDRASAAHRHSAAVERALAYVESHVFEPCSVGALLRRARVSESTLLRAFHRELGCSPAAYWRNRKLDEAIVLLRAGRESIAEVAAQVGYETGTAFAHAFRLRFGRPPSAFRPRRPLRRAP